jgi:hypothetical protein
MKSKLGFLLGALGLVGVSAPHPATVEARTRLVGQDLRVSSQTQTSRPIQHSPEPSHAFRILAPDSTGTTTPFPRWRGLTPKEWGMSRTCSRMVRKNRLRRLGVAGSRI